MHITYKTVLIDCWLLVRLPVISWLLVVKFLGSQKLYIDFQLRGGLVPLTSASFKGQLCYCADWSKGR